MSNLALKLGLMALVIMASLLPLIEPTRHVTLNSPNTDSLLLTPNDVDISRNDFPRDFIFGVSSSSYQYEGAANEDGRGQSIWDYFSHSHPDKNHDGTGDVAVDFYHRFKDDINLTKDLNVDAFRLSISWSRILPFGKLKSGVNINGILFYKDLIDTLLAKGLEPFVTLFYYDLPQVLQQEYGGFLSDSIVDDYRDFTSLCFKLFGDKVKYWETFNDPSVFSVAGFEKGEKAPGRCTNDREMDICDGGNSSTEPYIVSHNILLSHVAAVEEFRKCDMCKDGKIGITLSSTWFEPHSDSDPDKYATLRSFDFTIGWHLNPLIYGDYPERMKRNVGERLPSFTAEQSKSLINSFDFIGINYFGGLYVKNEKTELGTYQNDMRASWLANKDGEPDRPVMASGIPVYAKGIRYILNYTKDNYKDPTIYITENGYDRHNINGSRGLDPLVDIERIIYHQDHLQNLSVAIKDDKVNVKGYFVWTLMDSFEWNMGYSVRFGLYYVEFDNDLKRTPKRSAVWFKRFLGNENGLNSVEHANQKKVLLDNNNA